MRLADHSEIHFGYTVRGRLDPLSAGGVPTLQQRDVGTDGEAPGPDFQRYDLGKLSDRYYVRGGEVVFRSRGQPNSAAVIPGPLPEPVAVVVPLVIVRPDRDHILPEYLAWAINQPDAQRKLGTEAQGTNLRMIPVAVLENLDIPVPDLPTQKSIIELDALARKEGQLLRQLASRREKLVRAKLNEAARAADQKDIT